MRLHVLVATAVLASAANAAGGSTVYKCTQANGSILYADYPCKNGAAMDIKADAANPGAVERLQRAQAEFDRAYVERTAREEEASLRRAELAQRRREFEASQPIASGGYGPDSGYVPAYGFYGPYDRFYGPHDGFRQRGDRFKPGKHPEHHVKESERSRVPAVVRHPVSR